VQSLGRKKTQERRPGEKSKHKKRVKTEEGIPLGPDLRGRKSPQRASRLEGTCPNGKVIDMKGSLMKWGGEGKESSGVSFGKGGGGFSC